MPLPGFIDSLGQQFPNVPSPVAVVLLLPEHVLEIEIFVILGGLGPWVGHESLRVELLRKLHGVVWAHVKTGGRNAHQLHRVERNRPLLGLLFLCDRSHDGLGVNLDLLKEHEGHLLVERPHPLPLERQLALRLADLRSRLDHPEGLRLERLDLVMAFYAESQRRRLAGAVADQGRV